MNATKQLNTALCSFGMSGKVFHAPFIVSGDGFNLYAVWERGEKKAAQSYPGIISFDSLEELLTDDKIDLVIVNTPNYTHYDFTKKALLAGKHVLVEKAFTVTVSEALELINIAKEYDRELSVFQNRRYDSDFKTVEKIFLEGDLGRIVEAEFRFDRFNLNLSPKQHKELPNPGAGLLHDLGPHIIDQALYLFGMPESLFAVLKIQRPLSVVNDYVDIQLFYPQFMVRLKASLVVKEPPAAYSLHGLLGSFVKSRADIQEDVLKAGGKPGAKDWGQEPANAAGILNIIRDGKTERKIVLSVPGNYADFYNGLYRAIVFGDKLPVSGEDGLNVIRIIEAAQESDHLKSVVKL